MGQYSYTQPSSSEDIDFDYLLEEEAEMYKNEAHQSSFHNAEHLQFPPQPEADEGIPTVCYCGNQMVVATSYTEKDPGRRYYMCENVDDGGCHIWKWLDVALTEEMSELQRQLRMVKEQGFECQQTVVKLQKTVSELKRTVSEVKKSVSDQQTMAPEQVKRLWEQNISYYRVMLCLLSVSIGLGVMFITGR